MTGASEPKRFEHCLGVYHLADLWAKGQRAPQRNARIARAAALLHDMFTGPFGHSFQYVVEDNEFDQRFEHANPSNGVAAGFHQLTRAGAHFAGRPFSVPDLLGDIAHDVYAAIRGEGPVGPIISGTLDLDNLDNVVRLAFHMGLCDDEDRRLPQQLAPLLQPHDGGLAAPSGAEPLIQRWFDIRQRSYEFLLLDRGEFAGKAMLTFAVEIAAAAGLLGVDDWKLTDDALLAELEDRSVGEHQAVGQIVKRLRVGDLFDCINVWTTGDTGSYDRLADAMSKRRIECEIEEDCSSRFGLRPRINLHYILDRKKTCRSISFFDLDAKIHTKVGRNSDQLLVGAFGMSARTASLSRDEVGQISASVCKVLEENGLYGLVPADEPLADLNTPSDLLSV